MAKFPALDDKFPRIIPSFKQLVKIVSECVAGGVSLNCTAYEFCQCDTAMGTALANFMEVLRLKELPPERNEAINQIILIYIRMSSEMAKLETALGMDATAAAISCISNVYTLLKELENSNSDSTLVSTKRSLIFNQLNLVEHRVREYRMNSNSTTRLWGGWSMLATIATPAIWQRFWKKSRRLARLWPILMTVRSKTRAIR